MPAAKTSFKSRFGQLAIEMAAIVLSVLLALAANNWRESRKTDATVQRVLSTLRSETLENQAEVLRAYAYHQSLAQELRDGGRKLLSFDLKREPIDLGNAKQLRKTIYQRLIAREVPVPSDFEAIRISDAKIFLRIGNLIVTGRVEDGHLNLYGEGGIQLKSARIRSLAWEIATGMQVLVHMDYELVIIWSEIHRLEAWHNATVSKILDRLYNGTSSILPVLEDLVYVEGQLLGEYNRLTQQLGKS